MLNKGKTLDCILDDCPKDGKRVDWRVCSGGCKHLITQEEVGTVLCSHPKAKHDPKPERMDVIRASAGVQHLLLAGSVRGR